MRKISFSNNEYYHVYNRGIDRRSVFKEESDMERFLECIRFFNSSTPIGSLYENSFRKNSVIGSPLINLISYGLNPNHIHLELQQLVDNGISSFMHKLMGGYTWYFNNKYKREGSLFQGPFKAKIVASNQYLLYLSAYINLNFEVHSLGGLAAKLYRSSWDEYVNQEKGLCQKGIILEQFKTLQEYVRFAYSALEMIKENKKKDKELEVLLLE